MALACVGLIGTHKAWRGRSGFKSGQNRSKLFVCSKIDKKKTVGSLRELYRCKLISSQKFLMLVPWHQVRPLSLSSYPLPIPILKQVPHQHLQYQLDSVKTVCSTNNIKTKAIHYCAIHFAVCLVIGIIVAIVVILLLIMTLVSSLIAYYIFCRRKIKVNLITSEKVCECILSDLIVNVTYIQMI